MKKLSLILSSLVFVITGCGSNIEHQEVRKAPLNSSELGWIATNLTKEQHTEIMLQHPAGTFRNHGKGFAYEYRGLSKAEILEVAPKANVEKNAFVKSQGVYQVGLSTPEEKLEKFLSENLDIEFAPGNCINNSFLITPKINFKNISGLSTTTLPVVGNSLGFKNDKSADDVATTAWVVLAPNGSKIPSDLLGDEAIEFEPDMAGSYAVVLLYKKNGQCNFRREDFFVTNNTPYNPLLSAAGEEKLETLSEKDFYQLSATRADAAQALVLNSDYKITKVAVIDSGVNYNNPTLKRRMWTNSGEIPGDGIDNDQNGYIDDYVGYDFANDDEHPMDDQGHGSHVAGLVAGELTGISAENVQSMAVKSGGALGLDIGSIISGIMYAIENEADIINMSFGSKRSTEAVKAAMKLAGEQGILIVAASGNGNRFGVGVNNDTTPHYPASYDLSNILSVGSVRIDDALTRYSNYGVESVDVATVGGFSDNISGPVGLLSSAYIANPSGVLTQPLAGTSMASPVAAGIAGLILSAAPELTPTQVIELMLGTSRKVGILTSKIKSGAVLDAEAAVSNILHSKLLYN